MKSRSCSTMISLVCVACIACSCMPTTTWRQIRSDPQKYVTEQVSVKGEVSGQSWNWSKRNGVVILRDRNGDSGRLELPWGKGLPGIGSRITARGKVHVTQNDTGTETGLVLDDYARRVNLGDVLNPAWERSKDLAAVSTLLLLAPFMGPGLGTWN